MSVGRYRVIVADPPWVYRFPPNNPRHGHVEDRPTPYPSLCVDEIAGLPVASLACSNAALFLWTVHRYLPASFEIIEAWGFVYKQTLVWHKTGNPSPFTGTVAPHDVEFLLVAKRGAPKLSRLRSSLVAANVGRHSVKPEVFLDLIEQVSPGPYLELFARRNRLGWDTWGNQSLEHVEVIA